LEVAANQNWLLMYVVINQIAIFCRAALVLNDANLLTKNKKIWDFITFNL
jgi:hypothetical protein